MWYFSVSNSLQIKKKCTHTLAHHTPHHSSLVQTRASSIFKNAEQPLLCFLFVCFPCNLLQLIFKTTRLNKESPTGYIQDAYVADATSESQQQMFAVLFCESVFLQSHGHLVWYFMLLFEWMEQQSSQSGNQQIPRGQSGYLRIWLCGLHDLCHMQRY